MVLQRIVIFGLLGMLTCTHVAAKDVTKSKSGTSPTSTDVHSKNAHTQKTAAKKSLEANQKVKSETKKKVLDLSGSTQSKQPKINPSKTIQNKVRVQSTTSKSKVTASPPVSKKVLLPTQKSVSKPVSKLLRQAKKSSESDRVVGKKVQTPAATPMATNKVNTDSRVKSVKSKKSTDAVLIKGLDAHSGSGTAVISKELVQVERLTNTSENAVTKQPELKAPELKDLSISSERPVTPSHRLAFEPIYSINQRFAQVPLDRCPLQSNGYGFELSYPQDANTSPVITKVYGNAFLSGLKEGVPLITINGQNIRTQAEFNTIAYQGRARRAQNLITHMSLGVWQDGLMRVFEIRKDNYCLSNLSVETERDILRMDFNTKGTGYSAKADARVYVDAAFLNGLSDSDRLTIAAVAAGEQYRNQLRVKRGKVGLFAGQVVGMVVTLFTGLPVTDLTASSANAVGAEDRQEGALRPSITYGYYLGITPAKMRESLEKLATYRESYKVQGKRYDWPIPDDLNEFDQAWAELNGRLAANNKNLMLDPKVPAKTKKDDSNEIISPPINESGAGIGTY